VSEEADNVHPVIRLLVARMESHPEEFEPNGGGRWAEWLDRLIPFVTEEERVMLRGHMMQDIHEEVLDELMNGPERRAEEERTKREELKRWGKYLAGTQQYQNALTPPAYAAQLQNAYAQVGLDIQQYIISNGAVAETVDDEEIKGPGVLERILNRLIK
jgi:hypothetical protein